MRREVLMTVAPGAVQLWCKTDDGTIVRARLWFRRGRLRGREYLGPIFASRSEAAKAVALHGDAKVEYVLLPYEAGR